MQSYRRFLDPKVIAKISNLNLVAKLVVEGFISGLHKSPYQGFSVEFSEHKEYSLGDDLKHVDWKVYGKTDKLYIKRYEEETNLKAYILLDASNSMFFKSGHVSKYEYGCFLAASLAYLMIKQRDSVGLVVFDEKIKDYIPPKCSRGHLKNILQTLDRTSSGQKTNISKTCHDLAETIKRRGLIILISDLLDDAESVIKGLKHFRHKKQEVIVFHVLDKYETTFPYEKPAVFQDIETKKTLSVNPKLIREQYWAEIDSFTHKYKRDCSEGMIDYVRADTSVPLDAALCSYLSKRARLG